MHFFYKSKSDISAYGLEDFSVDSSPLKDKGKLVKIEIEIEILGWKILLKINAWGILHFMRARVRKSLTFCCCCFISSGDFYTMAFPDNVMTEFTSRTLSRGLKMSRLI